MEIANHFFRGTEWNRPVLIGARSFFPDQQKIVEWTVAPDQLQTLGPAVLNAIAMMLNSVGRGIKIVVVQDIQVNDKN